jgi:beta-aspartyl-peptidase (threonine type)
MTACKPAIIVHGGAGTVPAAEMASRLEGCRRAADAGWRILAAAGTALDAVQAAVEHLENDPQYNAGIGSALNANGEVEMDAAIMDGKGLRAGAVAVLRNVRNPIAVARRLLEDGRHVLLAGSGATRFARDAGFPSCDQEALIADHQRARWIASHGTVGAVALDGRGHLAAATSTGGRFNKHPGRVGDSPLIGCGTYADDEGAVSCTGHGEAIIRVVLAKSVVEQLRHDVAPPAAAESALRRLASITGTTAGLIVVDRHGRIGHARTTTHMPVAFLCGDLTHVATAI